MTKKEACWDGLGSWKSPEIRGSGLLARPTSTANAEGIQNRSSGGEPPYCRGAMEDSLGGSFHAHWIHLTQAGLIWVTVSWQVDRNAGKKSGAWTSNLFRKVVKEYELSGWRLASQSEKGRQRQRGTSEKMGACSLCPPRAARACDTDILPLLLLTEEMFVVTNLHLIIHVPGDFISRVHEQFMHILLNWILTRM